MIAYRAARNTDPPALVQLWNDAVAGRGAYPLRTPLSLERWVFSKPYYTNEDLVLAVNDETGKPVGFALSGFAPDAEFTGLNAAHGVVCLVAVHPEYRRRGVGRELLARAEANLRARGAARVTVGAMWPNSPYLFGLYGGSNSPGLLASDGDYAPFLAALGFAPAATTLVFQKRLDSPLTIADARFGMLRRRYEAQTLKVSNVAHWWQDCQWGVLEPVELRLFDKLTSMPAARALVWDLEGFAWRWNCPSAGILDVQVRSDLRKLGLGKLLVSHVLRFLQDQFFAAAELQVNAADEAAVGMCRSMGMDEIDRGHAYERPQTAVQSDVAGEPLA